MSTLDNEWESFLCADVNESSIDTMFKDTNITEKYSYMDSAIECQNNILTKEDSKAKMTRENMINTNYQKEEINVTTDIPKCSKFHISTQTKILKLNQMIDINNLFWDIPIIDYYKMKNGIIEKQIKMTTFNEQDSKLVEDKLKNEKYYTQQVINFVQNKNSKHRIKYKHVQKIIVGMSNKNLLHNKQNKKAFYNCISMVIRIEKNSCFKEFHIKLFNTGKVEIPGVQDVELMYSAINMMISILNKYVPKPLKYNRDDTINVISNSNFNCGYNIQRFRLYEILKQKYNIICSYDPCSYPGIKSKFYYNKNKKIQNGVCNCETICNKYDNANNTNKCKEISFMIFSTGSVLIVGNCDSPVLKIIYNFLKSLFETEYSEIYNGNIVNTNKRKLQMKSKRKTIEIDI